MNLQLINEHLLDASCLYISFSLSLPALNKGLEYVVVVLYFLTVYGYTHTGVSIVLPTVHKPPWASTASLGSDCCFLFDRYR